MRDCQVDEPFIGDEPFLSALRQLFAARQGVEILQVAPWAMAMEMEELLRSGCTVTQLRLWVAAGYLEHAMEDTTPTDTVRSFKPEPAMKFGSRTCFILTEAGAAFLVRLGLLDVKPELPASQQVSATLPPPNLAPQWNAEARELRVGNRVIKRFRRPAPVLERILSAFQDSNWPIHLDDPISPIAGVEQDGRLRDTIRRLNRCLEQGILRFESNGNGTGIRWYLVSDHLYQPRINHE